MNIRPGRMSVDLGPLKAGLYQAAHRAGVSPSVLARKAIAALLRSITSESAVEVSQPGPRVTVERGKPEGKVFEVRVKLREEDARTASGCARAEGLIWPFVSSVVGNAGQAGVWGDGHKSECNDDGSG